MTTHIVADSPETDYAAAVAVERTALDHALNAALASVAIASRALFELTELDDQDYTGTHAGEDATTHVAAAAIALRAAQRCMHLADTHIL
ncbi:hypothetical protein OG394_27820 [Kribbella sp. NBC_01245]|uniref:hypothetical protein n=1 Tax=Kribbella sp. NBC_01245 TaxID=2903578 RepID=UPI002E29228F|nr:hypothetical protein [Kribbella sp. NBC_01245]